MPCDRIARLPDWITGPRPHGPEAAAALSGAALAHLSLIAEHPDLPQGLWRDRLALRAAAACVAWQGRPERAGDLRDALHLLRPGDHPGPAGEVLQRWRHAVGVPVSQPALWRGLPGLPPDAVAAWPGDGAQGPVDRAAAVLGAVLAADPRAETAALILADAALARALRLDRVVPVLACGLGTRDLRRSGADLRLACHRAVLAALPETLRLAAELARRAARLQAVAPRLRARGARHAVARFLSRDAVAPATLVPAMSDRAARRICDRLVQLGVVRELTGRDVYRLYGL